VSARAAGVDYYAILQVHPDADFEVIEAAYRQLMKKHHPDMAGDDPARIAEHLERSKAINQAFSVLRDPERRRRYDLDRILAGTVRPAYASASPPPQHPPQGGARPTPPPAQPPPTTGPTETVAEVAYEPPRQSWLLAPLTLLSSAYYLLPGPYEWEGGHARELVTVLLLPPVGVAAFLLASGRLAPFLGHSLTATIVAWGVLALCAALVMWGSLLRVVIAGAPTAGMLSGVLSPVLQGSHVPVWLAWCLLSSLSLIFAARLFVFGVLPTLLVVWLLSSAH
jgi:hypothetical protein